MIQIQVPDSRLLLSHLLSRDTFDSFLLGEATITTYTSFHIDGSWHPAYLTPPAEDTHPAAGTVQAASAHSQEPTWARVRPQIGALVRGGRPPLLLKVVLKLSCRAVQGVLKSASLALTPDQVDGLFLNIVYQSGQVTCTSGSSLKVFSLDKSLDRAWDQMILKFFAGKGIEVSQM